MRKESAGVVVRAFSEGVQLAPSLFHFLIFLIFSRENWCGNAFRTPQPNWSQSRLGCGLTLEARSKATHRPTCAW